MTDFGVGNGPFDERSSKAWRGGFRDRRAVLFLPGHCEQPGIVSRIYPPTQTDRALRIRERAMLRSIGRKLMKDETERGGKVGRQPDGLAVDIDTAEITGHDRLELLTDQCPELSTLPVRIDKQCVRAGERRQPSVEAPHEILPGPAGVERLMGNRLNDGEGILDAMS